MLDARSRGDARSITQRVAGGTQQSLGAFVQDIFTPMPKLVVTLSARVDRWRNYDAHNLETTVATGLPTANNNRPAPRRRCPDVPEDRTDTVVSPRVAALYHVTDRVSAWGDFELRIPRADAQRAVPPVLGRRGIDARNDQLGPERLVGGELGVNVAPAPQPYGARDLVRQPREGSGLERHDRHQPAAAAEPRPTRIWGIQTDVEYRLGSFWRFSGGYLYNQARVVEFAANPALASNCPGLPRGSVLAAAGAGAAARCVRRTRIHAMSPRR